MPPARRDHFEATLRSWLGRQLDAGEAGRSAVWSHLADVYSVPLQIYYRGTSWYREYGRGGRDPDWTPETVIHLFIADRLGREQWMHDWAASGLPLRRWLMEGLKLFLYEYHRMVRPKAPDPAAVHDAQAARGVGGAGGAAGDADPEAEVDLLLLRGLVRQAIVDTVARLRGEGHGAHAELFMAVSVLQQPAGETGRRMGLDAGQVKSRLRLARSRFRVAFEDLLRREGGDAAQLERELEAVREIIG